VLDAERRRINKVRITRKPAVVEPKPDGDAKTRSAV
jgi:hypothetical protein